MVVEPSADVYLQVTGSVAVVGQPYSPSSPQSMFTSTVPPSGNVISVLPTAMFTLRIIDAPAASLGVALVVADAVPVPAALMARICTL